jgi:hypothetical protein
MRKGCKLYALLALNDKGLVEGLEDLPVVREFADVFPEELPRLSPKEDGIYHRLETWNRTDSKNTLSYVDP